MKKILISIGLLAGSLILASCVFYTSSPTGGTLTGQVWGLTDLVGQRLVSGTGISAQFTADGKVSGSSGCNQYSTTYTAVGSKITFNAPLAMTRMACDQKVMDQETAYMKMLADAKTYTATADQLTLFDASYTKLAIYKAQSQDLNGTEWQVIAYNNGNQAVTSVLSGTTISAIFNRIGNLSGNTSCNDYSGPFKVAGDQITIGPLTNTLKACSDPKGIMEQESQYLAALGTAATYQIEGDVLELRTRDGALAAQFGKK